MVIFLVLEPNLNTRLNFIDIFVLLSFLFLLETKIGEIDPGYLESPRINPPSLRADYIMVSPLVSRGIYIIRKLKLAPTRL